MFGSSACRYAQKCDVIDPAADLYTVWSMYNRVLRWQDEKDVKGDCFKIEEKSSRKKYL